jgi:hypothetical protein
MSGACPGRNTRCGLRRFIRSFGNRPKRLAAIDLALRRLGQFALPLPRQRRHARSAQQGPLDLGARRPELLGDRVSCAGAVRPWRVPQVGSPLADVRVLHPCSRVNWPFLLGMTGAEHFMNRINFYKNVGLMGGFLLLYVMGAGKCSIDARLGLSGAPPRRTQAS